MLANELLVNVFIPLANQDSVIATLFKNQDIPFCLNAIDWFNKELTMVKIPICRLKNHEAFKPTTSLSDDRKLFLEYSIIGLTPISFESKDGIVGVSCCVNKPFKPVIPKALKVTALLLDDFYRLGMERFFANVKHYEGYYNGCIHYMGLVAFVDADIEDYYVIKKQTEDIPTDGSC